MTQLAPAPARASSQGSLFGPRQEKQGASQDPRQSRKAVMEKRSLGIFQDWVHPQMRDWASSGEIDVTAGPPRSLEEDKVKADHGCMRL